MDDVIFSGSAGRPSREFAEVTLVLTEARGRAPAPFHNEDVLEVTRRIRRELGSTYRINGKEVRIEGRDCLQHLRGDGGSDAAGAAGHPQGAQGQAGREDHCHRLCCADNAGDVCRDARGFNGAWQ